LADRREDIPALVEHLLAGLPGEPTCSTDALEVLVSATWRGNVRELRNVLQAATHQASGAGEREIAVTHLPSELMRARQSVGLARVSPAAALEPESGVEDAAPDDEAPSSTLAADDQSRRDAIAAALAACRGNVTEAATRLNMRRATVYELMRRFGLDPRRYR
jgi:DNA-binding NtrC family response regulator